MAGQGIPFFRCTLCQGVVNLWDIYHPPHSCPKCGGGRVAPTNLTLWEKIVQIIKHPAWWKWDENRIKKQF